MISVSLALQKILLLCGNKIVTKNNNNKITKVKYLVQNSLGLEEEKPPIESQLVFFSYERGNAYNNNNNNNNSDNNNISTSNLVRNTMHLAAC